VHKYILELVMNKFAIDYQSLQGQLEHKKIYRLADVKDRIRKVAFDVVRFVDNDNIEGLWQIQHGSDGDYIVAMYDEAGPEAAVTKSSNWSVITDKSGANVNFFYKGTPIARLALATLGISQSDSNMVANYLPDRLASNPKLVSGLLRELSDEDRQELLVKYPELNK
jgi:hypothetical protein